MAATDDDLRLNDEEPKRGFIAYMFNKALKMQIKDWISLSMLGASFLPGKLWKRLNGNICVVSEYERLARDNGYWFYKYLRERLPDYPAYYPIKRDCADERKIVKLGNAVPFGSFKHYLLFWAASKQFTSSKNAGFPSRICEDLVQWNFHRFEYVLLNHGITRGKSTVVDADKTNYDYICTCSSHDKKIIVEENGQEEGKVVITGFARHDNLDNSLKRKNLIVIMPTWRKQYNTKYVTNKKEIAVAKERFLQSDFYRSYQSLLNNRRLADYCDNNGLEIVFYLHDYAQAYRHNYSCCSSRFCVADSESNDIQTLLKEGALLITDYSSVCYDFAYMYKPTLYYQFDIDEFEYYQYASGDYYSYRKDGMGDICYTEDELVDAVIALHQSGFRMPDKFKKRVDEFFEFHDTDNCDRIFERFIGSCRVQKC